MSQNTEQLKSAYTNKLDIINNQTASLSSQLNEIDRKVDDIDETLNGLPTRIQQIRKMNYRVMVNFEKDVSALSERWSTIRQSAKDMVSANMPPLASELRILETEIAQRRNDTAYEVSQLTNLDLKVSTLNVRISDLSARVSATVGDVENRLRQLDQDVGVAERTVNLTSNASFQWKVNETPILSANVKDLNNDVEGILSLTNQRFIFESEKEIVLKKRLFIATEKKKVRETVVDKPIGIVDTVTKGRVGLLAGQGIYVAFKPESGQKEMKLDTKGNDADLVIRFHKFISSGQADEELSKTEEAKPDTQPVPVICPRCGAPYPDEIYRGQTSVQCKYCSTTIPVSR
jgi:archaellum component FlaC